MQCVLARGTVDQCVDCSSHARNDVNESRGDRRFDGTALILSENAVGVASSSLQCIGNDDFDLFLVYQADESRLHHDGMFTSLLSPCKSSFWFCF